jgi:hypothetical protein
MPCVRSPFSVPKEKENYKPAPNLGVYCSIVLPVCLVLCGRSIVHKFALVPKSLIALVHVIKNSGA